MTLLGENYAMMVIENLGEAIVVSEQHRGAEEGMGYGDEVMVFLFSL